MAIIFMGMNLDLEFLLYCQFLCVAAFCCCCSLSRRACSIVLAIRQFVALPSLYIFGHFKEIQWCPRDIFCIFQVNAVWCCALLHCRYCLLHILLLFWILKNAFHHNTLLWAKMGSKSAIMFGNSPLFGHIGLNHLLIAMLPWSIGNVAVVMAMPPLRTKPFNI